MIIWYNEERKEKVNKDFKNASIAEIEQSVYAGRVNGFIIGDGKIVGYEPVNE